MSSADPRAEAEVLARIESFDRSLSNILSAARAAHPAAALTVDIGVTTYVAPPRCAAQVIRSDSDASKLALHMIAASAAAAGHDVDVAASWIRIVEKLPAA